MKRIFLIAVLISCLSLPAMVIAQNNTESGFKWNHVEVGAFADYFRLSNGSHPINYVGVGGRVGFNVHPNVALEAEMAYDFERNFTNISDTGATTNFVQARVRPIHGLFGPKFQIGTSGPIRAFVTAKVGLISFGSSNASATSGFQSGIGRIADGSSRFAVYPGAGFEVFGGPIGLRLEAGDDIYFLGGARNNLKVSIGPVIRF